MIRDSLRRLVYTTGWLRLGYALARNGAAVLRPRRAAAEKEGLVRVECAPGFLYVYADDAKGARYQTQGGSFRGTLPHRIWRFAAQRSDVIVDVGSNYGEYLISLVDLPGIDRKRMFSFEPNRRVAGAQLIALNECRMSRMVSLREIALSDNSGQRPIFVNRTDSGASSLRFLDAINPTVSFRLSRETVQLSTLDEELVTELASHEAIALKIDAEGHDWAVLSGAMGTLTTASRYFVMLETNSKAFTAGLAMVGKERMEDVFGACFYVFYHDRLHACSSLERLKGHLREASNNLDVFCSNDALVLDEMSKLAGGVGLKA